jgi:hypothetical protein
MSVKAEGSGSLKRKIEGDEDDNEVMEVQPSAAQPNGSNADHSADIGKGFDDESDGEQSTRAARSRNVPMRIAMSAARPIGRDTSRPRARAVMALTRCPRPPPTRRLRR